MVCSAIVPYAFSQQRHGIHRSNYTRPVPCPLAKSLRGRPCAGCPLGRTATERLRRIAIGLFVSNIKCGYGAAYPYDLESSKDLSGFNIEQQAAIVADYWAMTQGLKPGYNSDPEPRLTDHVRYIDQLRLSGPPHIPSLHDYDGVFESHA
jgi:hypothetical protein